jgi:hypothetical protein
MSSENVEIVRRLFQADPEGLFQADPEEFRGMLTLRDGKIFRWEGFMERDEALVAAGLDRATEAD